MSNVVLPRDVVERVRDFMYPHVFDLQGAEWAPARALLAALDAALAAPEPNEARLLRLLDLAAAMSGPTRAGEDGWSECRMCYEGSWGEISHAPDCPYAVFRAALEEVNG